MAPHFAPLYSHPVSFSTPPLHTPARRAKKSPRCETLEPRRNQRSKAAARARPKPASRSRLDFYSASPPRAPLPWTSLQRSGGGSALVRSVRRINCERRNFTFMPAHRNSLTYRPNRGGISRLGSLARTKVRWLRTRTSPRRAGPAFPNISGVCVHLGCARADDSKQSSASACISSRGVWPVWSRTAAGPRPRGVPVATRGSRRLSSMPCLSVGVTTPFGRISSRGPRRSTQSLVPCPRTRGSGC